MRKQITLLLILLCVCFSGTVYAEEQPAESPAAEEAQKEAAEREESRKEEPAEEMTEEQQQTERENLALKAFAMKRNPALSEAAAENIVKSIRKASGKYGVDAELIAAVIWIESNFDPNTVSGQCIGLMQIHVNTGKSLGLSRADLYNSDISIKYGVKYLSGHISTYKGDVMKALSAYNQGTRRVNSGNYSTWYQEKVQDRWNKTEAFVKEYLQADPQ